MIILIEHGTHQLANHGDIAMLQTTCERLRARWPHAHIAVSTRNPSRLEELIPSATPVMACRIESLIIKYLPPVIAIVVLALVQTITRRHFHLWSTIQQASLVVASGGGYINQQFGNQAYYVLSVLHLSQALNKPVWLFSQGFDTPLRHLLRSKAKRVLPNAGRICVREQLHGPHVLKQLGVDEDKIKMTGDDAIELAYRERSPQIGHAIGINIRVASYANIDRAQAQAIIRPVAAYADELQAPLFPFAIAHGAHDSDLLLHDLFLGDTCAQARLLAPSPVELVRQMSQCRITITGSYHGAVFALAQGIPAICLASSPYYANKFQGLSSCFGDGCLVIDLSDGDAETQIERALRHFWVHAEDYRAPLLRAAQEYITHSREAYGLASHHNQD